PKKKFIHKYDSEMLTQSNMDKSGILDELILKEYNDNEDMLLGEFQYAYITFILGEVYESFEQWK
ncbi:MAG: hypothetical protein ICV79_28955, partial [Flavisolibacter sp.]|nr:hypothetical protein [Flavisolibacter sp.]